MSVDYGLTLAGAIPLNEIASAAIPDPALRPRPAGSPDRLSASLYYQYGFWLGIHSGRDGYLAAQDDHGSRWEWNPSTYVNVTFTLGKDEPVDSSIPNMLTIVVNILTSCAGDAALDLNGDLLLLTRVDGQLRKHNRLTWWDHYGFVNDIIPG